MEQSRRFNRFLRGAVRSGEAVVIDPLEVVWVVVVVVIY